MKDKINNLKKQIKEIENVLFLIDMVDHWTTEDERAMSHWKAELDKVKGLLIEAIAKSVD